MCIKIVRTHEENEFDPKLPLEYQVKGARQVIIDYAPDDDRIQAFMDQMSRIVRTGVSCQMNIQVKSNNLLKGYQFERQMAKASSDLDLNEAIAMLVDTHSATDKKLCELQQMCLKDIL